MRSKVFSDLNIRLRKTFQFGIIGVLVWLLKFRIVKRIVPDIVLQKNKSYKESIRKYRQHQKKTKRKGMNDLKGMKQKQILRYQIEKNQAVIEDKSADTKLQFDSLDLDNLNLKKRGMFSQHLEEVILFDVFSQLKVPSLNCIEIGAGHNGGNILACMIYFGGKCMFVDGDDQLLSHLQRTVDAQSSDFDAKYSSEFITLENIESVVGEATGDYDYIGVDIDGNDYHLAKALLTREPKVAVIEYNPFFGLSKNLTVKYQASFNRKEQTFTKRNAFGVPKYAKIYPKGIYGASLVAIKTLLISMGYTPLGCIAGSNNFIGVRNDLCSQYNPPTELLVDFSYPNKRGQKQLLDAFDNMTQKQFLQKYGEFLHELGDEE